METCSLHAPFPHSVPRQAFLVDHGALSLSPDNFTALPITVLQASRNKCRETAYNIKPIYHLPLVSNNYRFARHREPQLSILFSDIFSLNCFS